MPLHKFLPLKLLVIMLYYSPNVSGNIGYFVTVNVKIVALLKKPIQRIIKQIKKL